ncbi:MAG TPA: helical backbone metal receptor [Thermoanaerobaculia bacterium]|nr:helical backbone metal receptor [Thermoanaerobaculia bacterium]
MALTHEYPPKRVVSLVPSLTETLFAIGAGASVVGITDFCIFPPDLELPRVGGTKNPRIDDIRALAPDLVHMNFEENVEKHARAIEEFAPVFVTEPKTVLDVIKLLGTLGDLHDCRERAGAIAQEIATELATMPKRDFTFAVAIWKRPWMWCGGDTYVSDLVECAGGQNVLRGEKRYPERDPASIDADVVFLPDEPYVFTMEDAKLFGPKVIGPFAGNLFTWHGSRTLLGLRFLRDLLGRNSIAQVS